MSTKSRHVIWGGKIMGAEMRAQGAREAAQKAIRDADRAEAEAWPLRMEGYGGPAQPPPTIGQCLNGGLGWLEVECNRCNTSLPLERHPPTARHAALEVGGFTEMPIMPEGSSRAARAQADGDAGDHTLQAVEDKLLHLFNHQTHHRGQAHACLSILTGGEPPSLDLLAFQRGTAAPDLAKLIQP